MFKQLLDKLPFNLRERLEGGLDDVDVDGINTRDYPDFCDAFVCYATWKRTGLELSEADLNCLNEDGGRVYEFIQEKLY